MRVMRLEAWKASTCPALLAAAREAELGKVLVFVSGFGEKEEEGRHLLAKLDFLQGEVVRKTWKACKSGVK